MSIEDEKPAVVVRAPSDIWLCVGDLADCAGCDVEFGDLREVSWCEDQIDVSDVKYVRADLYNEREKEIERLKGLLPAWIPVSERLPKDRQFVIYWIENAAFAGVGRFDPDSRMYHGSGGWVNQDDVSHWMPIPAPPEAGEVTK